MWTRFRSCFFVFSLTSFVIALEPYSVVFAVLSQGAGGLFVPLILLSIHLLIELAKRIADTQALHLNLHDVNAMG